MPCACVDIGSNTTRLLVAERAPDGALRELRARRDFTLIGKACGEDGRIPDEKLAEVADVVEDQVREARKLGARHVEIVATAAIREAPNRADLATAIGERCGLLLRVLSGADEARLCFAGATRGLAPGSRVAVVDVGGGSTEIAIGEPGGEVEWFATLPVGSSTLARRHLESDPPTRAQVDSLRDALRHDLAGLEPPACERAVAVGGSATSLRRLTGGALDRVSLERAVERLLAAPSAQLARDTGLVEERIRLLPAGLLVLYAVGERLDLPMEVVNGGLREGVLLELL